MRVKEPRPTAKRPRPGGSPMLMSVIEGSRSVPAYPELDARRKSLAAP